MAACVRENFGLQNLNFHLNEEEYNAEGWRCGSIFHRLYCSQVFKLYQYDLEMMSKKPGKWAKIDPENLDLGDKILLTTLYFKSCSCVSIGNFEYVNVGWVVAVACSKLQV